MEKLSFQEIKQILEELSDDDFRLDYEDLQAIDLYTGEDWENDDKAMYTYFIHGLTPERLEILDSIYQDLDDEELYSKWKEGIDKLGEFSLVAWSNESQEYSEYDLFKVYEFKDHGLFIKFAGAYSSYSSFYNTEAVQVEPRQEMVTIYKEI